VNRLSKAVALLVARRVLVLRQIADACRESLLQNDLFLKDPKAEEGVAWGLASTNPFMSPPGLQSRLPLVPLRRGRRTALILPLFPPPQKNRS